MTGYKYVIIGNSAAAIGGVEGIRKVDKTSPIAIISKETQHTYSRPLISYYLAGRRTRESLDYRPQDFYKTNNCDFFPGVTVTQITPGSVKTTKGVFKYEKLLIATGGCPIVPPIEGINTVKKKFTFMSLDSAEALDKELTPESRVLIMGGGLIGLKCAEGLGERVKKTTVVDLKPYILPSILEPETAQFVRRHIESHGIEIITGAGVSRFEKNRAFLSDGRSLDFDILVIAVGVFPNTELFKGLGSIGRGIIVDEECATDCPDIYAAGDCTESYDISAGSSRVLAILPNAYMQGECAGVNMAGGKMRFDNAIPMNAIGFWGLHIITAGSYIGEPIVKNQGDSFKLLYVKDNLLHGFIMVGDVMRAGIYTSLIRDKTPLDTLDFDLIADHPALMAFSGAERKKMLSKGDRGNE